MRHDELRAGLAGHVLHYSLKTGYDTQERVCYCRFELPQGHLGPPAKCSVMLQRFTYFQELGVPEKYSALASKLRVTFWGKFRISPRPISIRQLHTLPCFHPEPINLVVFKGSY